MMMDMDLGVTIQMCVWSQLWGTWGGGKAVEEVLFGVWDHCTRAAAAAPKHYRSPKRTACSLPTRPHAVQLLF